MKTNSAGALLFAIITAFVLSMVGATFVILTANQYRVVNSEIERIRAFYRAQAGMEWAIYNLYSGTASWTPGTAGYDPDHNINIGNSAVNINIVNDTTGISTYQIRIEAT